MSIKGTIKRYTTEDGKGDRALLKDVQKWNGQRLIPIASGREFTAEVPSQLTREGTQCQLTTTSTTYKGVAAVEMKVRRTSQSKPAFTIVLSEETGDYLTVIWP